MKKTGKCPKCGGQEIYTDRGQTKRGERASLGFSSWKQAYIDTYLCTTCGYLEEYVSPNDLKDTSKLEKLRENWKPWRGEEDLGF